MKKLMIIIIIVILILAVVFGVFYLTLNKEKRSITSYNFKTSMEKKGYTITDANNQFSEYDYIKQVYIASSSNYSYKIEYYELADENYAINFYNNNKSKFEATKEKNNAETSISFNNYSKYTLSTNTEYKVISRIDNTVIYAKVNAVYADAVKDILKELGY